MELRGGAPPPGLQVATATDVQVAIANDMDASFMSLLLHERGIHALTAGRTNVAGAHHRSQELLGNARAPGLRPGSGLS